MAITEPISEQIIQRIESRLKLIKTAGGAYPLNAEVYRADESGKPASPENKDFAVTIFVISDDEQRNAGDCGKVMKKMMVGFWLNIAHDADGRTAVGTRQARARACVDKALDGDPNCGGLAAVATVVTADDKMEQRQPAADLILEVIYRHARGNPFSL